VSRIVSPGQLIVLSAPSGGGKTTIAHALLKQDRNIVRSISCTTRLPRPGEKNQKDYWFLKPNQFLTMQRHGAFLEYAKVHSHWYGTPRPWVHRQIQRGKDVLMVIDVQGGLAIKKIEPQSLLIFLKPPTFSILKQRLIDRCSDSPRAIQQRLHDARKELRQARFYDVVIVNDDLSQAIREVLDTIHQFRNAAAHSKPSLTVGKLNFQ
jgi:guanylate kinase